MHSTLVYTLLFFSFILVLIELSFFIMFLITFIHQKKFSLSAQYSNSYKEYPNYAKAIIALEFSMLIFGICQFIFFIIAFKINSIFKYFTIVSLICFFCCWIATIILFCTSSEYSFIKSFHNRNLPDINIKLYSLDSFEEQINIWSKKNPSLYLQAFGSTENTVCFGYLNISTKTEKSSSSKIDTNFKDIIGDSIVLIDLVVDIKWNSENEEKINVLKNEITKCTKKTIESNDISKIDGIQQIPDVIIMTKDGKIPKKLTKTNALIRAIFGLGLDVITELTSVPIFKRSITISDFSIDQSFDCSKFDYQCTDFTNHLIDTNENSNDEKIDKKEISFFTKMKNYFKQKINNLFSKKSPKAMRRNRMSRSFYLCQSSYSGNFGYLSVKNNKNEKSSFQLMDIIYKNTDNGVFKPVFYVGVKNQDLYVVIRGSYSIFDWITDAQVSVNSISTYSYHRGFMCAADYVWNQISNIIDDYVKKGYSIIFTGHSYGGSVAQILHHFAYKKYLMQINDLYDISSYVFGAAASMGARPAKHIKNNCFSFVYCNDIVPRLLKFVDDFRNSGGFRNELIRLAISDFYKNSLVNSKDWFPFGDERIIHPVGTIYHLPYRSGDSNKNWGSISSTIKTINSVDDNFYKYNGNDILYATQDHSLDWYGKNMIGYHDGLFLNPLE